MGWEVGARVPRPLPVLLTEVCLPGLSSSGCSVGVSQLTPSLEVLVMTFMFLSLSITKQEGKERFLCKRVSLEIAGTSLGSPVVKHPPANRDRGFGPWSGQMPHAAGPVSPCAATTEPAL